MSAKKTGLGRSFGSLIPDDLLDESFDPTADQDEQVSDLRTVKVEAIMADPAQPRRVFNTDALEELAESIKVHGILQPIVVRPHNGSYMIVAGERRWRASKLAGLEKVPVLVRTLSDQHKLELSLIENLQRSDLNPLETATAYLKLRDQFNMPLEMIAKRMGAKSSSTISNRMRLLKLPKNVQTALVENVISEGQARPLIGCDEKIIDAVLPKIIEEHWSSRKVEQFIVQYKKQMQGDKKEVTSSEVMLHQDEMNTLSKVLDTTVKIRSNAKGAGRITISFKNEKEMRRIEDMLRRAKS